MQEEVKRNACFAHKYTQTILVWFGTYEKKFKFNDISMKFQCAPK